MGIDEINFIVENILLAENVKLQKLYFHAWFKNGNKDCCVDNKGMYRPLIVIKIDVWDIPLLPSLHSQNSTELQRELLGL